ncbi:MFS transporter [Acidithiobacillus sp.]|uniref:MFS transporter n=1 Tax=Acidithiobacillus sp. TaxID=1872118 RepID=UPI0025C2A4FD|nr:MFS transporter [Acidithiobacillus sp.]
MHRDWAAASVKILGAAAIHPDHATLIGVLDNAPLRLPHILAWALSTGGVLIDGLSVFMLGIAIPLLERSMALTPIEIGLLGAALVAGAVFGASLGGRLADRIGRKSVFLLDMSLLVLAAVLCALAWDPWLLICAQLLVGVGIGMDFPVSSSYVAECMPHRDRSRMMVATIASQSVGMLLAAVVALGLLHLSGDMNAWRLLFVSEAVLASLFLVARLQLPESPRWLIGQGRNREAVHALERLVPEDRQMLENLATRLGNTIHQVSKLTDPAQKLGFAVLFSTAYRRRMLLSTLPWLLMDIATYGVGLFTAVLLASLHFGGHNSNLITHVETLTAGSGLIDISLLLGFLIGMWAVARFGRIRMQMVGFAGMAVGMSVLLLSTVLPGGAAQHIGLVFTGFIVFNLSMNMGPNSTTYILPAELFPTQLRATGAGFAAACAKIGATAGVFLLPLIKNSLGVSMVLGLMAVVSLLGLLSTWVFRVEGHGRTLEELHQSDLP